MSHILDKGVKAPDFTLHVTADQTVSLEEYRGRNLVILFYPADWSPVCGDEIAVFNELIPEFGKHQADIVGISVDNYWCHNAFAKDQHVHFPLLADFEPKGEIAKKYGVYRSSTGICERAIFLVDKEGIIAWSYLSPIGRNPGADGVLDALEKLSKTSIDLEKLTLIKNESG